MKKVKITVLRRTEYPDLIERYEQPLEVPCAMVIGTVFVSENAAMPDGLCPIAWRETLESFVKTLAAGGGSFYGDWMKDPYSAMVSCNDGFRPVTYLLEAQD